MVWTSQVPGLLPRVMKSISDKNSVERKNEKNLKFFFWRRSGRKETSARGGQAGILFAMNSAPLVHVIVINWNGLEHLEACFDSLLASDYPAFQAVLTDNGSADGSVAFAREKWGDDPRFSALELGANLGWSGGNNAALRQAIAAGARYALLLNNDVRVAPDAISRAVARAESDPRIGAVALKMVLFGQPWILNSLGVAVSRAGVGWDIGAGRLDSMVTPPDAAPGACGGACLLRLEALEQVGLLPERFGIYLDDLDLCLRLWDAGWKVACCPDAVVEHIQRVHGARRGRAAEIFPRHPEPAAAAGAQYAVFGPAGCGGGHPDSRDPLPGRGGPGRRMVEMGGPRPGMAGGPLGHTGNLGPPPCHGPAGHRPTPPLPDGPPGAHVRP